MKSQILSVSSGLDISLLMLASRKANQLLSAFDGFGSWRIRHILAASRPRLRPVTSVVRMEPDEESHPLSSRTHASVLSGGSIRDSSGETPLGPRLPGCRFNCNSRQFAPR